MKKQNENHLYKHETKMIQDIKNMTIYIEQSVMRKIVQHTNQKNRRNIIFKHQKNIIKRKKQDEQLEIQKKQKYLIK